MIDKIITFEQDTAERKRWFTAASFSHPAKMHLSLQLYLIEHYTKKGDTILDPMTGSGTILVACALGRNVVCVELEQKFVDMQKDNWEKIKSLGAMLGYKMGQAVILQGDARCLPEVLVDCAIFSPPYAEAEAQVSADKFADPKKFAETSSRRFRESKKKGHFASKEAILRGMEKTQKGCGNNPNNISKLPYGSIPVVISSPPYAQAQEGGGIAKKGYQGPKHTPTDLVGKRSYMPENIGSNPNNISKLPYKADAVITSPPYEGSLQGKPSIDWSKCCDGTRDRTKEVAFNNVVAGHSGYTDLDPSIKRLREYGRTDDKAGGPYGRSLGHPYSGATENIGNLKSESYLEAMLQVYQNCHRVLKEKGLMILVVKNFIRDKKIVQLDLDTIKLCKQAGFALMERLKRKLTQMSFWRRIYQQKYPDAPTIDFEDVLVFRAETRPG